MLAVAPDRFREATGEWSPEWTSRPILAARLKERLE
jgi:hypothetical protein